MFPPAVKGFKTWPAAFFTRPAIAERNGITEPGAASFHVIRVHGSGIFF
jgi:hypothetical protein